MATDGVALPLPSRWILWSHSLSSSNWTVSGYEKLATVGNVGDFWALFNNLEHLGLDVMHYYFMREGIPPVWEDERNRRGGICTFKADYSLCSGLLEDIAARMVTGVLLKGGSFASEINGVSISPKVSTRNKFAIIKVWNSEKRNIARLFCEDIMRKYSGLSIQYRANSTVVTH